MVKLGFWNAFLSNLLIRYLCQSLMSIFNRLLRSREMYKTFYLLFISKEDEAVFIYVAGLPKCIQGS